MLDGLAYGKMIFDEQGRPIDYTYLLVNKNFQKLTGLNDVEGKKVSEVMPGITASNPDWFEIHGRVAMTGKPEHFETYIAPLAGWFYLSIYSTQKGFFVTMFQNVTERVESQKELEKFKLALDNISDNVIITDPEGIVVYANKAVEHVTGYKPEEAVGKKSGALWKKPMPREYYQNLWGTIKKKKIFSSEIQNRRKNGELYTAAINISPILNAKDEVEFFVSIERDITQEKEIDRAKNEFLSLASHQLRTPPSIISWYTEMLQSKELGPINKKQTDYLAEIYQANKRMIAIINSLLNISRIEMGTFSVSAKEIDLKAIIDETVRELSSQFKRTITLKTDYDPAMGLFKADPNIIQIIIDNLFSNAFKYSPPENTQIEVTTKIKDGSLLLSVKDNGIGIPAKDQTRVFEKLFRADNAVSANPDGTGLGLYMAKKIIDGVSGKIWFDSDENKGATFYVSLPASGMKEKPGTTTLARVS